jgi:hypothetical protein
VKRDLAKRLEVLEVKAKPRVISTWVDFILWLDEHEDDEGCVEVELCPELQELVETMNNEHAERSPSLCPKTICLDH